MLGTILRVGYSVMYRKDIVLVVLHHCPEIWMKVIRISAVKIEELSVIQGYCGQKVCAVISIEKWTECQKICDDDRKGKKLKSDKIWNKVYFLYAPKTMVFPVVMYGCESWTVKKAECRRIDAFKLWCCRRLLRVLWTARRSNQSILKISPGISLKGMMLKLKLQYFGHLMWRVDSLEKTLMVGGIGGRSRRGRLLESSPGWIQGIRSVDGVVKVRYIDT